MHHRRNRSSRSAAHASKLLLALLVLMGSQVQAQASSPEQWNKLRQATRQACLRQSGLIRPKVKSGPVMFQSHVLYRIEGRYPQPHMQGKKGSVYCLHPFNGEPEISEAPDKP